MIARYNKAWAAFAAGLAVVLTAGLITGSAAVWVSTLLAAVTAGLNTLRAAPNKPKG